MRPEMPQNTGFGETSEREIFSNVSKEFSEASKDLAVDLVLADKKMPDDMIEMREDDFDKKLKKPKKLGKKAQILEAENKRKETIMKVKDEIAQAKITNENYREISEGIIKKLGIEEEYFKNFVIAKVGLRAQIDRSKKRVNNTENRNQSEGEQGFDFGDLSIEDSVWMNKVCGLIKESRNNPDEIKEFWKEMREVYMEFEKDYDRNQNSYLGNKYGILAQVATEDLIDEISELLEKNNKIGIKLENTTPDDDVYNKIDLKANGLPYQIKSCKFTGKSADFIFKNMITVIEYGKKYSSNFLEQNIQNDGQDSPNSLKIRMKDKMNEFGRKALPAAKTEKGIFIMLPRGEVRDNMTGKVVNLLEDDGRVASIVKDNFYKQYGEKVLGGIDISKYCVNINGLKKQKRK